MCGITGLFHANHVRFLENDANIFFGLLLINSLRGSASTGVFGVGLNHKTDVYKAIGTPYDWASWKSSDDWLSAMVKNHYAVVGHGRLPTLGKVCIDNTHPFEHNGITLVHNGTLSNFKELQSKHKTSFETDSQLLTYLIGELGIEAALKEIEGAYALVWHDEKDEAGGLHILRNSQRPLCYSIDAQNENLIFGSEPHYIKWAAAKGYPTGTTIEYFPSDIEYYITKDKAKLNIEKTDRKKVFPHYTQSGTHYSTGWTTPSGTTSAYTSRAIVCVGEDIIFDVKEIDTLGEEQSPHSLVMIKGVHENNPKIQIFTHMKADSPLAKRTSTFKMIGRIRRISLSNILEDSSVRVFVENPVEYSSTNVVPFSGIQTIELKAGVKISIGKFHEYSKEGCFSCKAHPLPVFAAQCSLEKSIYYQKGEERIKYKFYCPTCSITSRKAYGSVH